MVLDFQPISKGPSRLLNLLFRTTVPRRPDLAEMVRAWSEILLVPSSQLASSGLTLWELAKPTLGENQVSMMNQGVYGHPSVESGRLDGMETARSFSAMLNPATVHVSHDSMLAILGKLKLPAPFTAFLMEITYPIIEALVSASGVPGKVISHAEVSPGRGKHQLRGITIGGKQLLSWKAFFCAIGRFPKCPRACNPC